MHFYNTDDRCKVCICCAPFIIIWRIATDLIRLIMSWVPFIRNRCTTKANSIFNNLLNPPKIHYFSSKDKSISMLICCFSKKHIFLTLMALLLSQNNAYISLSYSYHQRIWDLFHCVLQYWKPEHLCQDLHGPNGRYITIIKLDITRSFARFRFNLPEYIRCIPISNNVITLFI